MKRFLFFAFMLCLFAKGFAQYGISYYVNGYWSSWGTMDGSKYVGYGNYNTISFSSKKYHPSLYFYKFEIANFVKPSDEDIRYHYKNNIWYEYTGTFEYYICDEFPTAKDAFLRNTLVAPPEYYPNNKKPRLKQVVPATIKIAPFKDHPKVYNIFFEDVGIAFDLMNYSYPNW